MLEIRLCHWALTIALLALFLLVAVVLFMWQGVGRFGWLIFP